MTPVRFHNFVICSLLPGFAHSSMAQPCKRKAALVQATAENERLSRRMRSGSRAVQYHRKARMRGYLIGSVKLAWALTGKESRESLKGSQQPC